MKKRKIKWFARKIAALLGTLFVMAAASTCYAEESGDIEENLQRNSPITRMENMPEEGTSDSKASEKDMPNPIDMPFAGTDMENEAETEAQEDEVPRSIDIRIFIAAAVAELVVIVALLVIIYRQRNRVREEAEKEEQMDGSAVSIPEQRSQPTSISDAGTLPCIDSGAIGRVHNVGRRKNQQDTMGLINVNNGILAVVSDGMGGLADGEKVSQEVVKGMLQAGETVQALTADNPLYEMLGSSNAGVLEMLGPNQIYKSGATLLAILTDGRGFHWISVGDSRIYLYCARHLIQMNSEHIYKRQLLKKAVNRKISFAMANIDPQRDRLASFLGMGDLEDVDGSLRPVAIQKGDKLLMMSDGVFNTISEERIIQILESTRNAAQAAELMERRILEAANPRQDNFTCMILDF